MHNLIHVSILSTHLKSEKQIFSTRLFRMTARLESVGRISPEGIGKIKQILIKEDEVDEGWIQHVTVSMSSYFDIAVATRNSHGVILQPKFLQDPDRPDCPQIMHLCPANEINSLHGDITASTILPGKAW